MPRILVTGAAGYVGSHVCQKLLQQGFEVIGLDDLSTGFLEALPFGVHFYHADILDQKKLENILSKEKINAVIHLAGKLNVAESVQKPLEYFETNIGGALSLARACVNAKIDKVVFSSTSTVYGQGLQNQIITEDFRPAPISPYGYSKLVAEQIFQHAEKEAGLRSVTLRYFNVAGAALDGSNGQRTAKPYHLVHVATKVALGLMPRLEVFGTDYATPDGTCIRDYIHVEDLADLHVLALLHLLSGGASEIFNCGYGKGFSVLELVQAFKKATNKNFETKLGPRRPGDPDSLIANSLKIKKQFSWVPQRDNIDLICQSALAWEQSLILRQRR